jgi:hypothetical protein
MVEPASNEAFARAFAPLIEVKQAGVERPATPADVLELIEPPRYVLKSPAGRYLGDKGRGWIASPRRALVLDHIDDAREARAIGLREYGVLVKIVRLRRRGTCGIEGYRLRPDLKVDTSSDGKIEFLLSQPEGMALLAALTGGNERSGSA